MDIKTVQSTSVYRRPAEWFSIILKTVSALLGWSDSTFSSDVHDLSCLWGSYTPWKKNRKTKCAVPSLKLSFFIKASTKRKKSGLVLSIRQQKWNQQGPLVFIIWLFFFWSFLCCNTQQQQLSQKHALLSLWWSSDKHLFLWLSRLPVLPYLVTWLVGCSRKQNRLRGHSHLCYGVLTNQHQVFHSAGGLVRKPGDKCTDKL